MFSMVFCREFPHHKVEIFGWFTIIGYTTIHFRITYVWHSFMLRTIHTYIIWIKVLVRNSLNDFCLGTHCIFGFQVLFAQIFVSIWVKRVKYFCLIEGAHFDYLYFRNVLWSSYQLLLLLPTETMFDLEIPFWLLLDTKLSTIPVCFSLSCKTKTGFLVIVLFGRTFRRECSGETFFNFWQACNLFYIPMLPLILCFTDINSISSEKKWLFSERYFLFLERHVHSENKQYCYFEIFK